MQFYYSQPEVSLMPQVSDAPLQMEFIQASHKIQIGFCNGLGLMIEAAATDAGQFGLPCQGQFVFTVNHRLALSSPTLMSALSEKSFSNVNRPVLACWAFRSTSGLPGDLSKIRLLAIWCGFDI